MDKGSQPLYLSTVITVRPIFFKAVVTILLTLTKCNSKDKLGTYKVSTQLANSTIILYQDSTFREIILSDAGDKKCLGHWLTLNQKDSIIQTITESCGTMIFTSTPKRILKITGDKLIEVGE